MISLLNTTNNITLEELKTLKFAETFGIDNLITEDRIDKNSNSTIGYEELVYKINVALDKFNCLYNTNIIKEFKSIKSFTPSEAGILYDMYKGASITNPYKCLANIENLYSTLDIIVDNSLFIDKLNLVEKFFMIQFGSKWKSSLAYEQFIIKEHIEKINASSSSKKFRYDCYEDIKALEEDVYCSIAESARDMQFDPIGEEENIKELEPLYDALSNYCAFYFEGLDSKYYKEAI